MIVYHHHRLYKFLITGLLSLTFFPTHSCIHVIVESIGVDNPPVGREGDRGRTIYGYLTLSNGGQT